MFDRGMQHSHRSQTLTKLNLRYNSIDDIGAESLGNALMINQMRLDLHSSFIHPTFSFITDTHYIGSTVDRYLLLGIGVA